jgi:ABC-type antimicrobial peptide transport system permease subunit
MLLTAIGILIGAAAAALATRALSGMLFGVRPTDPAVFASVASLLALIALLATWLPARRASRIDPLEALRQE